jgi:hypothetical protein
MKDSYGYLLKLSIVLIVLLLILQTSIEYFTPTKYENFFQFENNASPANFNNINGNSTVVDNNVTNKNEVEKITVNLDKGILGRILGVDLKKMLERGNTAFQGNAVSENVDEEGNYIMPDYDYCDMKYWISKDAIRSLCPGCDPDKL